MLAGLRARRQVATQLAVSLVSGAVAGVVSAVVSQPADTVLSKMNSNQEEGEGPSLLVSQPAPP